VFCFYLLIVNIASILSPFGVDEVLYLHVDPGAGLDFFRVWNKLYRYWATGSYWIM